MSNTSSRFLLEFTTQLSPMLDSRTQVSTRKAALAVFAASVLAPTLLCRDTVLLLLLNNVALIWAMLPVHCSATHPPFAALQVR